MSETADTSKDPTVKLRVDENSFNLSRYKHILNIRGIKQPFVNTRLIPLSHPHPRQKKLKQPTLRTFHIFLLLLSGLLRASKCDNWLGYVTLLPNPLVSKTSHFLIEIYPKKISSLISMLNFEPYCLFTCLPFGFLRLKKNNNKHSVCLKMRNTIMHIIKHSINYKTLLMSSSVIYGFLIDKLFIVKILSYYLFLSSLRNVLQPMTRQNLYPSDAVPVSTCT